MADTKVTIDDPAGSGSPARVAWDMVKYMRSLLPETGDKDARIKAYLDLYADCYEATRGHRRTTGR